MDKILVMDCEERGSFWLGLKSGYGMLFATTGEEGLELLSEKIGLVFLSLTLRDRNSMEVLELITHHYPSIGVVVIAPCGNGEPCRCMEAFRKGAWDYIKKPLNAEEIVRKIGIYMDRDRGLQLQGRMPAPTAVVAETARDEQYPGIPAHILKGVISVRDYVAQNFSEPLSLAAACKMAATSKTYFCRFFKRITGHSLRSYHNVVRVQAAEQLLRDKRLSVADVAIKLGYHDSNYFSTIYKKMTGTPPKSRKTSVQSCGGLMTREAFGSTLEVIHR